MFTAACNVRITQINCVLKFPEKCLSQSFVRKPRNADVDAGKDVLKPEF